jgi:hypothetical protein
MDNPSLISDLRKSTCGNRAVHASWCDFAAGARAGEEALSLPAAGASNSQIRDLLVRAYSLPGEETRSAEHATALRRDDL